MENIDTRQRFPATTDTVRTANGQAALGRLVYKICSNFRRRTKQQQSLSTDGTSPTSSDGTGHLLEPPGAFWRCLQDSHSKNHHPSGDILLGASIGQSMLSVTRSDGRLKILCRLCEVARGWPDTVLGECNSVDDLDFERLLDILESDHGFRRGKDQLGWTENATEKGEMPRLIENARQWKAVLSHMLQRASPLVFTILDDD